MPPPGRHGGSTRQRGRWAEAEAARWLERQGFEVLARNHTTRRGEVDLVCREGDTLCFVEVRSRRADAVADPAETVTPRKARRVAAAAADWAARHGGLEQPTRFDVVAVRIGREEVEFEIFRAAFDASGQAGIW